MTVGLFWGLGEAGRKADPSLQCSCSPSLGCPCVSPRLTSGLYLPCWLWVLQAVGTVSPTLAPVPGSPPPHDLGVPQA